VSLSAPHGADAVVVKGSCAWGTDRRKRVVAYTGFLRRQDGQVRVRLEDKTTANPQVN